MLLCGVLLRLGCVLLLLLTLDVCVLLLRMGIFGGSAVIKEGEVAAAPPAGAA